MKQLSGLDALFLQIETPQMPMHVGALHVFELPRGHRGRFVNDLRRHIAARLPMIPALRRRVWWMPLNLANPAWVDAEPDMAQHIVALKLPKGAGLPELEALVGELHPVLLDRRRPLWKFHVIEGLAPSAEGRKRVALYTQLHHAAVDGQAAVALANVILDVTETPRPLDLKPSTRPHRYRLGMAEMLRGALQGEARQVLEIVRELPGAVGTLSSVGGAALKGWLDGRRTGGAARTGRSVRNLTLAPRTLLNVSVSEQRAFASATLPLAELKSIGKALGGTLNDMVLMLCAGALRRYLLAHKALPRKPLIAAVPISLRARGDTSADNQASMSFVSLGTHLADPRKRLAHVMAATAAMKAAMGPLKNLLPTDLPSIGVPWLVEAATKLYGGAGLADRIPQVANVVISNVPGPPMPLYLAGARMLTNYPTSIVVHGIALNITVQSYDASMDVGLMADKAAMPDVRSLADALMDALDELRTLIQPATTSKSAKAAKPVNSVKSVKASKAAAKPPARKVAKKPAPTSARTRTSATAAR